MTYLVFHNGEAFYTNWFDAENNFVKGMIIFNRDTHKFSTDGITWKQIEEDHL